MSRQNRQNIFLDVNTKEPEIANEEEILDIILKVGMGIANNPRG